MPPTDNSAVQVTISVVDANSGEVVSKITKSLNALGDAGAGSGKKLKQGLNDAGEAGTMSGRKIADGMDHASSHSLNALDNVRLVRDDLGIRIPRAMEKVISQSKLAMGAIGALGSGLVILGGLEIFGRLAAGAFQFYERVFDVTGQLNALQKKMGEAASQKFFDVASIEEVNVNLSKTTELIKYLDAKRLQGINLGDYIQATLPSEFGGRGAGLKELMDMRAHGANAAREAAAIGQSDDDVAKQHADRHKAALQEITDNRARAAALKGYAADAADAAKKIAEARENRRYGNQQTDDLNFIKNRANGVFDPSNPRYIKRAADSGKTQEDRDIASAQAESSGKNAALAQGNSRETRKVEAEAREAGLKGEAKFYAAKQEQIRELREKVGQSELSNQDFIRQRTALESKYGAERVERLRTEQAETERLRLEANSGGLTGLAKIDANKQASLAGIAKEAPGFSDPNTRGQREAGVGTRAIQEAAKEAQSFTERLAQLDAARADRFESESQRIQSAADRSAAEILKAWKETYGGLGALDQRRVQSAAAVQDEITKIQQDAARQQSEVRQKLGNETVKMEREGARAGGANRQSEQTQAILDEYHDRYDAIEQLRLHDAANADLYRRQEVAAERIKNGKLVDEQRAMRDRLAGQLQGLFSNPLEALKRQGEEMASKAAATYLMKLVKPAPGTMGTGGKGTLFGGMLDGMGIPGMERYGGGRVGAGANPRSKADPGMGGPLTATPVGPITAASSTLSAATATIHIGSATITGVGFAGAGASGAGMRNALYTGGGNSGVFGGSASSLGSPGDAGTASASSVGLSSSSSSTGSASGGLGGGVASGLGGGAGSALPDNVQSVVGSVNQLKGMGTSVNALGKSLGAGSDLTSKIPGMGSLSKLAGNAKFAGAAGGALGLFSAYEGSGGFGGALGGAVSGAKLGAMFGGPAGAAIGAIAGGVLGFIGFGARNKAARYDGMTVKPQIANDLRAFEAGTADYQSTYDDLDKLSRDAKITTRGFGSGAKGYYNDHIVPEIKTAQERLTRENKAGRTQFGMSAAQFHTGGLIGDFGSMRTSSTTGFVHAEQGEVVLNQQAAMSHGDVAMMMNAGASRGDMASYYGAGAGTAQPAASPADVNLHFHTPDAKGARDLFMANKHHIRAALNESYGENSGGYDYV